ncbi:outer membrane protein assembly factor BamB family protein [Natranaeroarchaeum sulfidigenes]|uniref:WD40/PQQ-like beta propeller repeat containing protein n=1 Tax=Natranaeroarchaeum sulfidigenes TaxID=2784880 RepID=A0A897MVV5_9EURY|nr:PQQ-binding-like beta-propeller repeat protein [Natranaeroarchaeum sulfidigenes]QSG02415.1 WD40/PQQ-like beta propeller repeat containing protein [Natranaeroarchaeum sulfidigenes]
MSEDAEGRLTSRPLDPETTVELPELTPRSTRQQWTRSALASFDDADIEDPPAFLVGTGHGVVRAVDDGGTELWSVDLGGMAVALEPTLVDDEPVVLVGTRGETAVLALLDAIEGRVRWSHDLEADLGSATKETLFYYPMTVDLASDATANGTAGDRLYAAARRYERDGDDRDFESRVYAFDPDGTVAWTYDADASPIALDRRDDRVAVAYNRCHGDHQCGLVVLDAADGDLDHTWDPGTDGGRRVGDVALDDEGVVLASHGDYRGYALDRTGGERWQVDLGRPLEDDDTVYTYPNHVTVDDDHALFVTGNTFPEDGRDTDERHPDEHSMAVVDRETGDRRRTLAVDGWLGGQDWMGDEIALAVGQHFRDRDPETHGLRFVGPDSGENRRFGTDGIAVAVAVNDDLVAVLEEPIAYHDEDDHRGAHRLRVISKP